MNEIRVLLADDHAVLRAGLKMFINAQKDMTCVGEAADGEEAIRQTEMLAPDILLLDLGMPGLGGLDALPEIRKRAPATRVLILTMHSDAGYLRQALARGAAGYVLKKAADQELLNAIRAVGRGEVYVHSSMMRMLLDDMLPKAESPASSGGPPLSEREEEVLVWVARGYTNQEVADRLALSVKTVETYRARAMNKLQLKSRAELVRYALAHGWMQE